MTTNASMAWLREAVGGIKFPPDRRKVEKELYAHILDRNRDFLREGCTEREADEKVCAAMGDPVEIRRELAALHRPFWGYAFLGLRILAVGILAWALIAFLSNTRGLGQQLTPLVNTGYYSVSRWLPQSDKVRCGDYTFRLRRAAWAEVGETGEPCLLLELRASTADPFLGAPCFPVEPVTLMDSRGQTYPVFLGGQRSLVFNSRLLYTVYGMEEGADWAVLTLPGPEGPVFLTLRLGEGRT